MPEGSINMIQKQPDWGTSRNAGTRAEVSSKRGEKRSHHVSAIVIFIVAFVCYGGGTDHLVRFDDYDDFGGLGDVVEVARV
jgi:hypothetical protein